MVVEWCRIESLDTAWWEVDRPWTFVAHSSDLHGALRPEKHTIHPKGRWGTSQDEFAPLDDQKSTILCFHSRLTFSTRDEQSHHARSVSSSAKPAIGILLVDVVEE